MLEAVRLADDVGVQRYAHHQRALFAFGVQHVEGVDDHVSEVGVLALARNDLQNVVELLRGGDRQDATLARVQPDRLIVVAPVEQIAVASFLQQIGRDRRL